MPVLLLKLLSPLISRLLMISMKKIFHDCGLLAIYITHRNAPIYADFCRSTRPVFASIVKPWYLSSATVEAFKQGSETDILMVIEALCLRLIIRSTSTKAEDVYICCVLCLPQLVDDCKLRLGLSIIHHAGLHSVEEINIG